MRIFKKLLKFLILFNLYNIYFCEPYKIIWSKAFLEIDEETETSVFGTLMYKFDNKTNFFFVYHKFDEFLLNKICSLLNYDNFQSFSMSFTMKESQLYLKFDLKKEPLKYL